MVVSEVLTQTPKEEAKKTKTKKTKKKAEETKPKPTETKPKEEVKEAKPIKEAKEEVKTKEAKPTTTRRPKIKTITQEKFEKFATKTKPNNKSWIKEAIERAKKEPIMITGLTKGQILSLVTQVKRYNRDREPKINIKYDTKKGIALLAPIKKTI